MHADAAERQTARPLRTRIFEEDPWAGEDDAWLEAQEVRLASEGPLPLGWRVSIWLSLGLLGSSLALAAGMALYRLAGVLLA